MNWARRDRSCFVVNHLAPYVLNRALLPLLEALRAYCRSELAMITATFEPVHELSSTGVTMNALHPAPLMDTDSTARKS